MLFNCKLYSYNNHCINQFAEIKACCQNKKRDTDWPQQLAVTPRKQLLQSMKMKAEQYLS